MRSIKFSLVFLLVCQISRVRGSGHTLDTVAETTGMVEVSGQAVASKKSLLFPLEQQWWAEVTRIYPEAQDRLVQLHKRYLELYQKARTNYEASDREYELGLFGTLQREEDERYERKYGSRCLESDYFQRAEKEAWDRVGAKITKIGPPRYYCNMFLHPEAKAPSCKDPETQKLMRISNRVKINQTRSQEEKSKSRDEADMEDEVWCKIESYRKHRHRARRKSRGDSPPPLRRPSPPAPPSRPTM